MGGEGEGAKDEGHEEHAAVLEVVEVGGVEGAAGGEDAEVGGVEHLDAHVREGAAGDDVELEQPQRGGGAGDDGVPGADAEGGGGRGEAGSVGPRPGRGEARRIIG